MPQQLAVIVLVDVGNALESGSLKDNTYLFDNMKLHGSEGQGTGDLVTAIHGSYWADGSQASEQVLNWLPYSLGSLPPTVPRGYQAERARQSDAQALADLAGLAAAPDGTADLDRIRRNVGSRVRSGARARTSGEGKVLDVRGRVVHDPGAAAHAYPTPVITDITGEAVDEKIIYPAQYGSPDLVTDGWYWSASIDTSRPGTYACTMHVQLHDLVQRRGQWTWEPVDLTCESRLRITTEPRRNAFTKAGTGYLPIAPQA
ncbi:hypothetical protein [Streptomyces sp. TRM64462]|uniref:hypothetical protein n=1 Tax=Streptomyces sp. TRM64462 TaxID=2741726 RepID=UPI0015860A02|nr:hypothetical protein [Streptomyces sp. TRM64462]